MTDDLVEWLREVAVEMRVVGMARCEEAANCIEELKQELSFLNDVMAYIEAEEPEIAHVAAEAVAKARAR